MSNETFHKTRGLKRHGPVTVIDDSEDVGPMKLYAFCKRSFPHLSKKVLINCFLSGSIFVNGEKIRCGHADESRRLVVADVIEIQIDMDASDARIIDATELSILHIQSGFAVISKPCGLSAAFDKELDKALKVKLWDGKRKQECHQLYHLEKGFSGICIVAETAENLSKLRLLACATSVGVDIEIEECDTPTHLESDWNLSVKNNAAADVRSEVQEDGAAQLITAHSHMNSFLELTYRCIICGKVGEVGERVFIKSGHSLYPVIEASVLQISRCRSKDFISLIDIRVTFDFAPMGVESFKYDDDDDDDDIAGQECLKNNNDLLGEVESEIPLGSAIDMEKEFDIAAINSNKTGDDDDSDCCNDAYFDPQTVKIQNVLTVENIKNPKTREDYRYLHYPTIRLKSIKRALSLCGHTVVGDGGAVKSAKGIFAAVVKVTIFDPDYCEQYRSQRQHENQHHSNQALSGADGDVTTRSKYEPIIISVEDPKKFQKLLGKEQELWERSEDRDQVLISAWNQNQKNEIAVIEDNNIDGSYKGSSVDSDLMDNRFLKAEDTEGFQNDFMRCHLGDSLLDPGSNKTNDYYSSKKETANDRHQSKVKSQFSSLESMRDALSSGMPVEYVLGEARFCGLDFTVDSNVMVPRKSSEILVYQATSFLSNICPPIVRTDSMIKCTADLGSNSGIEIADRGSSSRIALNYIRDQDQHQHQHQDRDQDQDRDRDRDREGVRVLDIGTGSGCLLLSSMKKYIQEQEQNYQCLYKEHSLLYHEKNFLPFPPFHCNISGVGIDISPEALTVAAANSIKLGLENNAIFKVLDFANLSDLVPTLISTEPDPELTDSNISIEKSNNVVKGKSEISFFEGKTDTDTNADSFPRIKQEAEEHSLGFSGPYDVILCNPPYSSRREKSRLSVACREHEPSLALFSPLGPLAAYRILATSLREAEEKYQLNRIHSKQLNSLCFGLFALDAHIILEVGHGQDVPVRKLFDKLQFLTFVRGEKDHKGIDRCLIYRYLGYDR